MTRAFLLASAALLTTLALPAMARWQFHDRNNEPTCAQPGNVDPRCYVAQLQDPADQTKDTDQDDEDAED